MNIGIVGARKYQDRQSIIDLVDSLPVEVTIITSSCKGVCTWAREQVEKRNMHVMVYAPDLTNLRAWFEVPKRYYQRNKELVEACDFLYAFSVPKTDMPEGRGLRSNMRSPWVFLSRFIGKVVFLSGFISISSRLLNQNPHFCCLGRTFSVKLILM
jgi:hypothetical protein